MTSAGVLTLDGRYNYGNRLQNYAVHQLLMSRNLEPRSIRFDRVPADIAIKEKLYLALRGYGRHDGQDKAREKMFDAFEQYVPSRVFRYADRKRLDDYFDLFVIGSDQVWNPSFAGLSGLFFLPWAKKKKIALAASFGRSCLSKAYRARYAGWLRGIADLSVREEAGKGIVDDLIGREATVLLDPVFSLNADAWSAVSNDNVLPDYDYVLAYVLGAVSSSHLQELEETARRYGSRLIMLSDRAESSRISAGPSEFISLVKHSRCVLTDSFHASAFSAIYRKPLCLVQRQELGNTSSRFVSLFDSLKIEPMSFEDALEGICRYDGMDERIRQQNEMTNSFLDRALKPECVA